MARVVVAGGWWAGCAAALAARKAGAEVVLFERTDQLLGTGLVGGIMRNNGRFTAAEEMIALGAGELFLVTDALARHERVEFPGHQHATLYDVTRVEPHVRRLLQEAGVDVYLQHRVISCRLQGDRLESVEVLAHSPGAAGETVKTEWEADAFVDATGSAGPQVNCIRYGRGCCMCILRCPSFGPRVSLARVAGVEETAARTSGGGVGSMSGACELAKESLSPDLRRVLDRDGVVVLSLPPGLQKRDLSQKACQQYALEEFGRNLVLLDTGHAKLMTTHFPLAGLRAVPGLEYARYVDPYAGGRGNSMRLLALTPHDAALAVRGVTNLFCAGEKAGPLVGHTEAICTGTVAGHNAARVAQGLPVVVLPPGLCVGDMIAHVTEAMSRSGNPLTERLTFSGSTYFQRMRSLGLYSVDRPLIHRRVWEAGLTGLFAGGKARRQEMGVRE